MEWRIIVPVLCLIGILPVPGNAADTNSTNTTTISPLGNGTNNIPTGFEFNIVFHINESFSETYFNMSNNATIARKNEIISQVMPVYTHLKNFERFDILQFRNGSIVVDGKLHFNSSDSKPTEANLTQILNNGNFTFKLLTNLTRIAEVTTTAAPPAAPATTANQTANANQTTTTAATTASTPAKITTFNVVFKILQTYKDIYANLSNPETIQLTENITTAFSPFYKQRFTNFRRMWIRKFSQGSIVADSVFEFDNTNNTSPNVTEMTKSFTEAIATGNFSFAVDNTSISVTDITNVSTTTQAATTVSTTTGSTLAEYNMTIKINETFNSDLTNISSPRAVALAKNITDQFDGVFKKRFSNFVRTFVWRFRSGSIIVDALLGFNKTGTNPAAADVVKVIQSETFTFKIESLTVTDSNGTTANRSPVLSSMLTALWMTLVSLLVSAVMH